MPYTGGSAGGKIKAASQAEGLYLASSPLGSLHIEHDAILSSALWQEGMQWVVPMHPVYPYFNAWGGESKEADKEIVGVLAGVSGRTSSTSPSGVGYPTRMLPGSLRRI